MQACVRAMSTNDIDMPDSLDADQPQAEPLMEAVNDPADADMEGGSVRSLPQPASLAGMA